jgi:two-component system chemotaxis response regulator CheB
MPDEAQPRQPARKQSRIRVLVVDDSAVVRKALTMMLESDGEIQVVGTARDGEEGIEKVRRLQPDLVTMDIEMPRMDGLAALREIMLSNPVPVVMISSLTSEGADATLEALDMGAVDFIPKGRSYISLDILKIKDGLLAKIKTIARRKHILMARATRRLATPGGLPRTRRVATLSARPTTITAAPSIARRKHTIGVIVIGSSTGGPLALQEIIPRLPRNLPVGVLVAQHMPSTFTKTLAARLDGLSEVSVREAENGDHIAPGQVLIAPGGKHLTVKKRSGYVYAVVSDLPADTLYKPCIDVSVSSVVDVYGRGTLGVILTGMGNNGVDGIRKLHDRGGIVIAQDEESCVVYGMPRAVVKAGLADHVSPIENVVSEIISYF